MQTISEFQKACVDEYIFTQVEPIKLRNFFLTSAVHATNLTEAHFALQGLGYASHMYSPFLVKTDSVEIDGEQKDSWKMVNYLG